MDWNALLEDQASNENRNKLIVQVVKIILKNLSYFS